jgi:inosose dehydratase
VAERPRRWHGFKEVAVIRVAAAPCSWGVFEVTIGQPGLPAPDVVLDQMVEAGYEGTELGPVGYLGSALETRERLAARRLELVGAFVPLPVTDDRAFAEARTSLEEILAFLRGAAPGERPKVVLAAEATPARQAAAGRLDRHPELLLTGEPLRRAVDNLHRAAELCREAGLEPVLHPHGGTPIETVDEVRAVAERLDPALLGICLDTGHAAFGGADPVALLDELGSLVRHVHLKDLDPAVMAELTQEGFGMVDAWRRGVFTELGTGSVNVPAFLARLVARGYAGWVVVEQDRILTGSEDPGELLAAARRNRERLAQWGLALAPTR